MYTTIQEAHEIFRGISENKMFFILEEIGGKVMMGTASDLVNLINADGIMCAMFLLMKMM